MKVFDGFFSFLLLMISLSACGAFFAGCGAAGDVQLFFAEGLHPPRLEHIAIVSANRIELQCDCMLDSADVFLDPPIEIADQGINDTSAWFELSENSQPGTEYIASILLKSDKGHSSHLLQRLYGFNGNPASLIFNEIIVRGSGNNPDCIELLVKESGNLGGLAWYLGTSEVFDTYYLFPAVDVVAGDYITLHVRNEGLETELDELDEDLSASGGLLCSSNSRDLWLPESTGLPSNNGVMMLYQQAGSPPMDAFLYSDRFSDSDTTYSGFGTAGMLAWILDAEAQEAWVFTEDHIRPEDCVSPEGSTGTRSINRSVPPVESRTREDWHIVPTSGATIGSENSMNVYEP
jgi:hypothetical protein